jgi:hypothetical protein
LGNIGFIVSFWHSLPGDAPGSAPNVVPRMGDVLEKNMAYNA